MRKKLKSCGPYLLLVIVALLTRLPFLDAGYGTNVDAWRVARAARAISESGEYEFSRMPGYPVHEIVCSWFWQGGPIALNALSAAFGLAAVLAVWQIARRLRCRDSVLLSCALASTPVFFLSSLTAKDYIWALAFVLCALLAAIERRSLVCGLLLGLAIGCRITSAAMFLPLALVLYGNNEKAERPRSLFRFAGCAAAVAALAFLPVWQRYGWTFLFFYQTHARPDVGTVLTRSTIEIWGTLGLLGFLLGVGVMLIAKDRFRSSLPAPANRLLMPAFVTIIAIYAIAFLRLPDQAGYLLPLVPAVLFLSARFAPRPAFQIACACLCLAPWVEFAGGKPTVGPIIADQRERRQTIADLQRFVALTEQALPGENTIMVGAWEPIISELFARKPLRNHYVYVIRPNELHELLAARRGIAYSGEISRAFNWRMNGIDLAAYGALNLRQLLVGHP